MCHHCVIESVKKDMLSRRSFFAGLAVAAGAAIAGTATAQAQTTPATTGQKAEDLTHNLVENFPTYFGAQQFWVEKKNDFAKDGFNINEWRIVEHTGTHIDAPLHFTADGKGVGELAVEDLVARLSVIDIRAKADANADAELTPDDIKSWTDQNGPLPDGGIVAMLSGWGRHVETDKFRNLGPDGKTMHFPGFHIEAIKQLLETSTKAIAVDTLSLDFGQSPDFIVHKTWLPSGRYGIEGIANLDRLPAKGATIVVGAPKIAKGSGGPARVIALV
ncbi:MAG: cyclase family protein [Rhizobiaceae bacterium]